MATSTKTDPKAQWRGTVVEFFVDKRLTLGVCLEIKGERFLILTEGDREINLPESRFLHVAPHALNVQKGRDQLIQSLRDIAKRREELRARVEELGARFEQVRNSAAVDDAFAWRHGELRAELDDDGVGRHVRLDVPVGRVQRLPDAAQVGAAVRRAWQLAQGLRVRGYRR